MQNQADASIENKPRRKFPWGSIGILLSTFALIVLIYVFYYVYCKLSMINITIAQTVSRLQITQGKDQQNLTVLQQEAEHFRDELKKQSEILGHLQSETSNKDTWSVLEAQYLVNQASNILRFEHNVIDAIALLSMADNELRSLNNPKLENVRQALAADMTKLQAIPVVDLTGIFSRLTALDLQIDKLPLLHKSIKSDETVTTDTNLPWWKQGFQQMMVALRQIVIVRYHSTESLPLITPEQQDFLLQNVHAKLEQAIWAMLHREQSIYATSLQQATDWIKKYFAAESPETVASLTNLNQLQQINIAPTIPDINPSLQAFHDYFASQSG